MTGFESVAKGSEEAKAGFDPRNFATAIYAALVAGFLFYVLIIAVVTYVYPWQEIVCQDTSAPRSPSSGRSGRTPSRS